MAEQGVECLKDRKDAIKECVEEEVPEVKDSVDDPNSLSLDDIVIDEKQCGWVPFTTTH